MSNDSSAGPASDAALPSSRTVAQLQAFCRKHPVRPKTVFVPYQQLGRALETALARRAGLWGSVECVAPAIYARRLADQHGELETEPISSPGHQLLTRTILENLIENGDISEIGPPARVAPQFAAAISTLRESGVGPEETTDHVRDGLSAFLPAVYQRYVDTLREESLTDQADVYREATAIVNRGLEADRVYAVCAETDLSERALHLVRAAREHSPVYLLETERGGAAPAHTAGAVLADDLPAISVSTGSVPEEENPKDDPGSQHNPVAPTSVATWTAVGPIREVRAALREMLRRDAPLDDVELAYTSSRPYLALLVAEAEKAGIPVTSGTGIPVLTTRPGQMISGLFRWVEEGYSAEILIRLLRSGLVRTEAWMQRARNQSWYSDLATRPWMTGANMATLLAESRYPPHRGGYRQILTARIEDQGETLATADPESWRFEKAERTRDQLVVTLRFTEALLEHLPETATVATMAECADELLERFGPSLAPVADADENEAKSSDAGGGDDESDEDDGPETYDQIGQGVLRTQMLPELQAVPVDRERPIGELASFFRNRLAETYVGAQQPEPGAAHILPLDSAGFSGRDHLFVVGMDSETVSAPAAGDAVLGEEVRSSITESQDGALAQPRGAAEETAWRFQVALDRHCGTQTLIAMSFDPDEGEERFPSSIYLERANTAAPRSASPRTDDSDEGAPAANEATEEGEPAVDRTELLVPSASGPLLSKTEAWLSIQADPHAGRATSEGIEQDVADANEGHPAGERSAGRGSVGRRADAESGEDTRQPPATAEEALERSYPLIASGREARRSRRSGRYTAYDGLLPAAEEDDPPYPELDFLASDYDGPPMSANGLQTLAASPYAYFVKYVLGVEPLDEPALSDEPWLNNLRKGSILHDAFDRFMREDRELLRSEARREAGPAFDQLMDRIESEVTDIARRIHIGDGETREAILRRLSVPARLFIEAEKRRAARFEPARFEWGFGQKGPRRRDGDLGPVPLSLSTGEELPVRGRVDRIDEVRARSSNNDPGSGNSGMQLSDASPSDVFPANADPSGERPLQIWDYKTGSQSSFEVTSPLKQGEKLQWALYAAVAEEHLGRPVDRSGYVFFSEKEMGSRIAWPLSGEHRSDLEALIQRLAALCRTGTFPMRREPDDASTWRFGDYDELVPDLDRRGEELESKSYPADRPDPPCGDE